MHAGKGDEIRGTTEENNNVNNDEDLNVFEVEHSNYCHTALVYNDDGDEVDEHGNTQWVLSANKSLQDEEYMINHIKFGSSKNCQSDFTGPEVYKQSKETE